MRQFIVFFLLFAYVDTFGQFGPVPPFFNIQRELPLINLNTTSTISVSDFGAVVNDGNNDIIAITNAINAAVNSASEQNPVKLLFESGTYDLIPNGNSSHSIEMVDANGILWDGQNAEFLVHNPSVGFLSLLRCENTILKDFSVDYAQLPFTQGVVTNVDVPNGFFEFEVDNGFPLPTSPMFMNAPQRWGMIKNSNGSLKRGSSNLIPHQSFFQLISGKTYKYNQSTDILNTMDVGDYFVHIARNNGKTIIRNTKGKNLTYLNVTAYTSPAGGFNARGSEEWNVINCQIKFKGSRKHTLNADAMHVNGGKIAPWVENSLFEGFADDCLNLKHTKRAIKVIHSPTELTVEGQVLVGEQLEFYNPRDGIFLGSATVTNVINLGGNEYQITFSNPINITTILNPDHQLTDKAYIIDQSNQSFVFKNNIVRNSRRHGILIQSRYALIENNLFQNISSSGIAIQNGVDWGEGFRANDIVINNNTFLNCGFDAQFIEYTNSATIKVDFMKLSEPCNPSFNFCGIESSSFQAHSNLTISNNEIIYNKKGVYLKNIDGVILDNNFICHSPYDTSLGANETPEDQTILNSSNVSITNFNCQLPTPVLHSLFEENNPNSEISNIGSDNSLKLKIELNGGVITQGFFDNIVGNSLQIDTDGNGSVNVVDNNTEQSVNGPINGESRTYAFWIKPEQNIFQNLLFSGGPNNGEVFAIQMLASGVIRVTDNNQNTVSMADMPLDIGSWNHVLVSVPDGAMLRDVSLYKNGVASNEIFSGTNVEVNTAPNSISLFTKFKGIASDFRYFDFSLCDCEVEAVFNDRFINLSNEEFNPNKNNIIAYPTITSTIINFNKPITSIDVFDVKGKIVFEKTELQKFNKIDVSSLSTGIYFIKINNSQTIKIIKE